MLPARNPIPRPNALRAKIAVIATPKTAATIDGSRAANSVCSPANQKEDAHSQ